MNQKQVAQELVKIAKSMNAIIVDPKQLLGRYEDFRKQVASMINNTIEDLQQIIRQISYESQDIGDVLYPRERERQFTEKEKKLVQMEDKKRDEVKGDIIALQRLLKKAESDFR